MQAVKASGPGLDGSSTRLRTRATWSHQVECASRAMHLPLLAQAIANYEAIDDNEVRLLLVREIAECRGPELTLAYRNLIMLASGLKRKNALDGKEHILPVPCVIFVVRTKWRKSDQAATELGSVRTNRRREQTLPPHLMAHITWNGARVLVAVPTDVQHESSYYNVVANSDSALDVITNGTAKNGTLTCLVQVVNGVNEGMYGLSALHVLSPYPEINQSRPSSGATVQRARSTPTAKRLGGVSDDIGGKLVAGPHLSFDVQLSRLSNLDVAKDMLRSLPLSKIEPFIGSRFRFDQLSSVDFEICVPSNLPGATNARSAILAKATGIVTNAFGVNYETRDGKSYSSTMVHHRELIQLSTKLNRTIPGDSGSAVVLRFADGTCALVGMHIAGKDNYSYVLPAWAMFHSDNYNGTLGLGASIRPISATW